MQVSTFGPTYLLGQLFDLVEQLSQGNRLPIYLINVSVRDRGVRSLTAGQEADVVQEYDYHSLGCINMLSALPADQHVSGCDKQIKSFQRRHLVSMLILLACLYCSQQSMSSKQGSGNVWFNCNASKKMHSESVYCLHGVVCMVQACALHNFWHH